MATDSPYFNPASVGCFQDSNNNNIPHSSNMTSKTNQPSSTNMFQPQSNLFFSQPVLQKQASLQTPASSNLPFSPSSLQPPPNFNPNNNNSNNTHLPQSIDNQIRVQNQINNNAMMPAMPPVTPEFQTFQQPSFQQQGFQQPVAQQQNHRNTIQPPIGPPGASIYNQNINEVPNPLELYKIDKTLPKKFPGSIPIILQNTILNDTDVKNQPPQSIPLVGTCYEESNSQIALPNYIRPISTVFPRGNDAACRFPSVLSVQLFNDKEINDSSGGSSSVSSIPILQEVSHDDFESVINHSGHKEHDIIKNISSLGSFELLEAKDSKKPLTPATICLLFDITSKAVSSNSPLKLLDIIQKTAQNSENNSFMIACYEGNSVYVLTNNGRCLMANYSDEYEPFALSGLSVLVHNKTNLMKGLKMVQKLTQLGSSGRALERGNLSFAVRVAAACIEQADRTESVKNKSCFGKILAFHCSEFPVGVGNREDPAQVGSKQEYESLTPDSSSPSTLAGLELQKSASVSVDLFVLRENSKDSIDLANLSALAYYTSGNLYKYNRSIITDTDTQQRLEQNLDFSMNDAAKYFQVDTRFNCVKDEKGKSKLKLVDFVGCAGNHTVCSDGYGDVYKSTVLQARCDRRQSYLVEVAARSGTSGTFCGFLTITICYRNNTGQRVLRVHRYRTVHANDMNTIQSTLDPDVVMSYVIKKTLRCTDPKTGSKLKQVFKNSCFAKSIEKPLDKNALQQTAIDLLARLMNKCYKQGKGYASGAWLPARLGPTISMLKSFLANPSVFHSNKQPVRADDKTLLMFHLKYFTSPERLHRILLPTVQNINSVPPYQPLLPEYNLLNTNQIYSVDNGLLIFIWMGQSADIGLVQQLLANHKINGNPNEQQYCTLAKPASPGTKSGMDTVVARIRAERDWYMPVVILRQGDQSLEPWFKQFLSHDAVLETVSYDDFFIAFKRKLYLLREQEMSI